MSVSQRGVRSWAAIALIAQVVFVVSWLIAGAWQGPHYSPLAHTISDMYAVGAPHGAFLVVVLTVCGAATMLFAVFSVWPTLRSAGWSAPVGSILLALSIFGLGDLLTAFEREGCRLADAGCTSAAQVANSGGRLDSILSTMTLTLFIAAGFFLAAAMDAAPGWKGYARPMQVMTIVVAVLFVATGVFASSPIGGLLERLLAAAGAATIGAIAVGVLRRA